jgi:hypothetical protein
MPVRPFSARVARRSDSEVNVDQTHGAEGYPNWAWRW